MAENKTKATKVSPKAFLDKQSDEGRRKDCAKIVQIMKKANHTKSKKA